jgi:soluble lytic murein transglycosylase-like protein
MRAAGGLIDRRGFAISARQTVRRNTGKDSKLNAMIRCLLAAMFVLAVLAPPASAADERATLDALIAQHASANGVPVSLVRRVVMRESHYNARAVSGGNYGLMQIRLGTARALGYRGTAAGLLDPDTNMTYAVGYLAGAYRAAGGQREPRHGALQQRLLHQPSPAPLDLSA